MLTVIAHRGGLLVSHPISDLRDHLPTVDCRIVSVYRNGIALLPDAATNIEVGDEVFVLVATENVSQVLRELRQIDRPVRKVMIAGGGNVGVRVAHSISESLTLSGIVHVEVVGSSNCVAEVVGVSEHIRAAINVMLISLKRFVEMFIDDINLTPLLHFLCVDVPSRFQE